MTLIPKAGAIRTWIDLYGPLTEAQDTAHLGAAIALISAAVGWKAWIKWGENAEPCTVNVVLEGRSATSRKTTVANSAHALARMAMEGVDEGLQQLKTRTISHTSNRGLLEVIGAESSELAARWEIEPPPGHLLVWDEFGSVLGDPGDLKGQSWLGQVRTTLMQLTNGRHGGIQTGGAHIPPARCAVSLLSSMTRVELEARVSTGLLRDGFMGRFLLIPNHGRARILSEPPAWTPGMSEARTALVDWIRALSQTDVAGNVFNLLSDEARALRHDWYGNWVDELEGMLDANESEENAAALEAFGRLQSTALKVAVVAACAEWNPAKPLSQTLRIEEHHVSWGHEIAELCLKNILELAQIGDSTGHDRYAAKTIGYLEEHGGSQTRKQLLDAVRMTGLSRDVRWKIIEGLAPDVLEITRKSTPGRHAYIVTLPGATPNGTH